MAEQVLNNSNFESLGLASSLAPLCSRLLDKTLCSTLSLFTLVYGWGTGENAGGKLQWIYLFTSYKQAKTMARATQQRKAPINVHLEE